MCVDAGLTKNTYGTGCFLLQNTGERPVVSQNRLLSTVAWQVGGKTMYALEGSVFIGGAVVQWLRDGLGIIRSRPKSRRWPASVPDSGGVYLVPAFAGLGAPHWDPYARGTIVGITRGTTAAHIARAAVEEHRVPGGRSARSDAAATPASRWPNCASTAARPPTTRCCSSRPTCSACRSCGRSHRDHGARCRVPGGLAVGFWDSTEALAKHWRADKRFEPSMPAATGRPRGAPSGARRWTGRRAGSHRSS